MKRINITELENTKELSQQQMHATSGGYFSSAFRLGSSRAAGITLKARKTKNKKATSVRAQSYKKMDEQRDKRAPAWA